MRKLLKIKLKILAKLIIKKYQPKIIGITGSIGKSSAKSAISHVLTENFNVRTSYKNYNNEIGLPLTIIEVKSPGKDYFYWFIIILKALKLLLIRDKSYPKILVLEMGVDRPRDMDYLLSIVKPDIAVVTAVSYSHMEFFGSLANIKKEKQRLVEALSSSGVAILNYDSAQVKEMEKVSKAKILSYGIKSENVSLQAQDIIYNFAREKSYELSGINFKLNYQGATVPVYMKNVLSEAAIYATLAAIAVAVELGVNVVNAASAFNNFFLPPGRMNILPGIKHSFIIDDTYNSSPEAAISAINILGKMNIDKESSKYAVLGDMLEIGSYTIEGHRLVGRKTYENKIDYLLAVGERARDFIRGAKDVGMNEDRIYYFDYIEEAGRFLQNRIKAGDVILVKGSQGARMEKVVKEIMAEPEHASELLIRQDKKWLNS
jgi:UDP-N-acetylmuramoyl-tripeptide--D-alanyl-D-alanine ligase